MRIKSMWLCLLMLVLTTGGVYLVALSNDSAAVTVTAAVTAAAAGDYMLAIGLLFIVGALVTILLLAWEKENGDFSPKEFAFSLAIFLMACIQFGPASREYNWSQLDRDQSVVAAMSINLVDGKMEIGLPLPISAVEQRYLEQTLTISVGEERYSWRQAICRQNGSDVWYILIAEIPLGDKGVSLKFRHVWWDYEATMNLP